MVNQFLLHIALTVSYFLGHLNVESKFDFRLGVPPLERAHSGMRRNLWREVSFHCGGEHWVAFCGFASSEMRLFGPRFRHLTSELTLFTFLFLLNSNQLS